MLPRALGGAILLAALSGCPRPPPVERPYAAPSADELRDVLERWRSSRRALTMNARTRATSWLGGKRIRSTVYILVDRVQPRGGGMRFEAEVSLQGTVAVLVLAGIEFSFLDLQNNAFRRGSSCAANVAEFVGIPLDPEGIAEILWGGGAVDVGPIARPGPGGKRDPGSVAWDSRLGADVLTKGDRALGFKRRGNDWDIVAFEGPSKKGRFKALYEDLETIAITPRPGEALPPSMRLPRVIRFAEDGKSFDDGVEIVFKERTLGEDIPAERFKLDPPPGVKIEDVDCSEPTPEPTPEPARQVPSSG